MNLTTSAGRRLFTDVDPMDMWESNGVTPADIAAVEAEAREQERGRIAAAVRMAMEDGAFEGCGGFGCQGERLTDYARVLAAIEGVTR